MLFIVLLLLVICFSQVGAFWLDLLQDHDTNYETEMIRRLQGPPLANYTSGFWRSNYFEDNVFIQAEVLAIGVCYAANNFTPSAKPTTLPTFLPTVAASAGLTAASSPAPTTQPTALLSLLPLSIVHRKLVSVTQNKGRQAATLLYAEYTDFSCSNFVRKYSTVQKIRDTAVTNNGVQLSVQRQFVTAFPPTLPGRYTVGYIISYFGADEACFGNPYKLLAGTDRCANYPTYFGRVRCNPTGEKLLFYEYPFSVNGSCAGEGQRVRKQRFACSNEGIGYPSYQEAVCVPV